MAEKISRPDDNIFIVSELKNLTTELNLLKLTDRAEVLQCDVNTVTFQAPTTFASVGQLILLKGLLKLKDRPEAEFSVVGKISELVSSPAKFDRITIKMSQYDKSLWKAFLKNLDIKQTRVDKILNSMKDSD